MGRILLVTETKIKCLQEIKNQISKFKMKIKN